MSEPKSPLDSIDGYSIRHILVGFQFSQDADNYEFNTNIGKEGTKVPGGTVLVNEISGKRFKIGQSEWEYNFYGSKNGIASTNIGMITIIENIDFSFLDLLYDALGDVSISHMAFALKTYWIGGNGEIITANQYIFNVSNIVSTVASNLKSANRHIFTTMGISQTTAQLPSYSLINQMTLTHKEGGLHKTIPAPTGITSGLQLRSTEDGIKYPPRIERINLSPPMKKLEDIFQALELELNEQTWAHKGQLQQWMRNVRDDHVDKIKVPPKQNKQTNADPLPIVYHVKLDDKYKKYVVDNRNIPHEQPEQDQTIIGIRSIGIPISTNIIEMVEHLFIYSKQIGEDAKKSIPEIPKVVVSTVRETGDGKQHIYIIIKKIKIPINTISVNTGPGEGKIKPLTYYVNNVEKEKEVLSVISKSSYVTGNNALEEHVDEPQANIVYGNREQVTFERKRDTPFFKTMYSGVRMLENPDCSATEFGDLSCSQASLENKQRTVYTLKINGNPYLLNDINRRPFKVATENADNPHYYKFPEYYPIYMKLIIYQDSYKEQGGTPLNEDWLKTVHGAYKNYYHVSKIKNIFRDSMDGNEAMRGFHQEMELRKTDEKM